MRSIMRKSALVGAAASIILVASPAFATDNPDIVFVPGTGEPTATGSPTPTVSADKSDEPRDAQAEMQGISAKLSDPRMQDGVAHMVGSMTERMMDFPVGKFAAAIEKAIPGSMKDRRDRRIGENDTIADLAGRDADRLPDALAEGSRQMMGMMSGFAAAFAGLIPEFEKLGREMEKSFEDIKDTHRPHD